jgi:hypothetical protein
LLLLLCAFVEQVLYFISILNLWYLSVCSSNLSRRHVAIEQLLSCNLYLTISMCVILFLLVNMMGGIYTCCDCRMVPAVISNCYVYLLSLLTVLFFLFLLFL